MGTAAFQAGTEVVLDGRHYRLLRKLGESLWQLEDSRTKRILERTNQELNELYSEGKLTFVDAIAPRVRKTGEIVSIETTASSEDWETAKVRRLYVIAIEHTRNTRLEIEAAVQEVWARIHKPVRVPGYVTAYRWKKVFIDSGRDIRALLPRHADRGNHTQRYPQEVETLVSDAIETLYLSLERPSIQETLDHAIGLVGRENQLRPTGNQLPLPTRSLMKRMIQNISAFDRYVLRHGRTAAVKRFRAVLGHRITEAPLERAEIDHTPLDLIVLDDATGLPLGRPYITALIDDYSRCILGLYISFEPPSFFTVARCLKHAFLPKAGLQKQYPSIQNGWDAHGVMRELVVDNGQEFHSTSLENACLSLGIEIHYSARKVPWFKGKIERYLGSLNRGVAHVTPGTTFSNILDKEDYDPSKFAVVRFNTLKEIVYIWVADVYHQRVHRTLKVPPAVMWARSISDDQILLPDDPTRLDFLLGKSETRTLTHKGIELDYLFYNSPELTALRRRLGDKLEVEIRVDTSDIGHIHVLAPDGDGAFRIPCTSFAYANGLSAWQHKVCRRFAERDFDGTGPEAYAEAKLRIRELIDGEFMLKKRKTNTKIARFQNRDAAPESKAHHPDRLLPINSPMETHQAKKRKALEKSAPKSVPTAETHPITTADMGSSLRPRVRKLRPILTDRTPQGIKRDQGHSSDKKHV